jgi:DNA segregation ATPase FtsK/SpoIIIE-like protein
LETAVINQLRVVFRQPEIIAGKWKAARVHDASISEADATAALQRHNPLWDELLPTEQARIVGLLVERVDIGADVLNVRLRVYGLGGLARELHNSVGGRRHDDGQHSPSGNHFRANSTLARTAQ